MYCTDLTGSTLLIAPLIDRESLIHDDTGGLQLCSDPTAGILIDPNPECYSSVPSRLDLGHCHDSSRLFQPQRTSEPLLLRE